MAANPRSPAAPTVVAVASVANLTTIDFQVTGTVGQTYTVEFFASSATGASPAFQFLGTATPTLTTSTQKFTDIITTLSVPLQSSQSVTATLTASSNDTSEFASSAAISPALLVTNTSDNVAGANVGSLRQAILDADNITSGSNSITFQIPTSDSGFKSATRSWTIALSSALPPIKTSTLLDGTSQPGYIGAPIIQIDGSTSHIASDGLQLALSGSPSAQAGFSGSLATEGFLAELRRGLHVLEQQDVIQSNYLGTNVTGTAVGPGNLDGLLIDGSSNNTVGGSATTGNLISGNTALGVLIQGNTSTANVLLGNRIGTDATGTVDLHNSGDGVQITRTTIGASNNTIGEIRQPAAGATLTAFSTKAAMVATAWTEAPATRSARTRSSPIPRASP